MADRITDVFTDLGYRVADGPEVEAEWFNFDALNMGDDHFARDPGRTFYVEDPAAPGRRSGLVLRAHTSPVQVREMLGASPPIRVISTGRVFRPDAPDATHSPVFHQAEGLAVDRRLTPADLKDALDHLAAAVFGDGVVTRLRPYRFAYTEPSAEVDVACAVCRGTAGGGRVAPCRTCGGEGWVEWGGCGMIHPRVLATCGVDPAVYRGFAFGVGVERTLMLREGLKDMRDIVDGAASADAGTAEPPLPARVWPEAGPGRSRHVRRLVGRALAAAGYTEAQTFPFLDRAVWTAFGLDPGDPRRTALGLVNPIDPGRPALRTTLLPGLLDALRRGTGRNDRPVALFEQGTVFASLPGTGPPPRPPAGRRPGEGWIHALLASVPAQPHHVAAVTTAVTAAEGAEPRWEETVEAARTAAGAAGVRVTARRAERPPWRAGRCVALFAGRTLLGHAGGLRPETTRALGLSPGAGAMEIDLTVTERLTDREQP
ncbi:hypothetical protein GCM10017673_41550 [Streptosporangium violaceochromogenes]|nr:hypothetical protein GCM10017673_41550 [Streptosporangium violaceochromogenes]